MGFFPVSKIQVERTGGDDRKLILTYWDDELGQHTTQAFAWEDYDLLLARVRELLLSKSM